MTAPAGPAAGSIKLESVQLLRAIAASMVVVGHLIGAAREREDMLGAFTRPHFAGGAGVDVFFLISGFIMVYASRRMFGSVRGAGDFMIRRLIRIVPLYWGVTALVLALLLAGGRGLPSAEGIAASVFFLPYDTTGRGDGFVFPVVNLGWTLNYEMLFYLLFALFIPLGREKCVAAVVAALALIVSAGVLFGPQHVALRFWSQPIILEFGAGMIIALFSIYRRLVLPVGPRILLVAVAIAYYLADPAGLFSLPTTPNGFARVLSWGVASALLLIAAISGPVPLSSRAGALAVRLGDASYALYLLHPLVIVVMLRLVDFGLFSALPQGGWAVGTFMIASFVVASAGSILFYLVMERPVTDRLSGVLARPVSSPERHLQPPSAT